MRTRSIAAVTVLISLTVFAAGCYEDVGGSSQQAQQPAPAGSTPGPITGMGQSNGSALGAAKRSATNVVEQAEQRSRETAEHADDPVKDQ